MPFCQSLNNTLKDDDYMLSFTSEKHDCITTVEHIKDELLLITSRGWLWQVTPAPDKTQVMFICLQQNPTNMH